VFPGRMLAGNEVITACGSTNDEMLENSGASEND
jgi:hypothetical protein